MYKKDNDKGNSATLLHWLEANLLHDGRRPRWCMDLFGKVKVQEGSRAIENGAALLKPGIIRPMFEWS